MVEAAVAIEAASPPGVEDFEWRERYPAHVAKSEPDTKPTASEAEEADQRGRPVVPPGEQPGVPAPASAVVVEPAAVVVGSPTPGVGTHPSPAIIVFIDPTPGLVRRPVGAHVGTPYVAVLGHVVPGTGGIQILRAVDSLPT